MDGDRILSGLELRLRGLPYDLSSKVLKTQIKHGLENFTNNILVYREQKSEDEYWQWLDKSYSPGSARVVIPNNEDGTNPGNDLIERGNILVYPNGRENDGLQLTVERIPNPTTRNAQFEKLQSKFEVAKALENGPIGRVRSVSCGMFDVDNRFETAYTWPCHDMQNFHHFNFYGDSWPAKFQICLTQTAVEPLKWEWMDLHMSNVRGIILENAQKDSDTRTIYFALDKPPQFYQRTRSDEDPTGFVRSRIPHPTITEEDGEPKVCNIPWIIQYSRIFKVEYESAGKSGAPALNLNSLKVRLSVRQKQTLYCFRYAGIEQSFRTRGDMIKVLTKNMDSIEKCIPPDAHVVRIAILRLLYNCHVNAWSGWEVWQILQMFEFVKNATLEDTTWDTADLLVAPIFLKQAAFHMETSQVRALRRLRGKLSEDEKQRSLPRSLVGQLVDPQDAMALAVRCNPQPVKLPIQDHFQTSLKVFEVMVYPSHVEIQGPVTMSRNSVIDEYREYIHWFVRVRFLDNGGDPLRAVAGINQDRIIGDRVSRTLNKGIRFSLQTSPRFEFLGYSMSGLKKKRAVWFFCNSGEEFNARVIRDQIGYWCDENSQDLIVNPSKWGARVASAFTESIPVTEVRRSQAGRREDAGAGCAAKLPNTDGCGLIDPYSCDVINSVLARFGFRSSQAFQIRYGGVKGVVYSAAKSLIEPAQKRNPELVMLLRKSQVKFEVSDSKKLELRIVSTAGDSKSSLFFMSLLQALEALGASTAAILAIYEDAYTVLDNVSPDSIKLLKEMFHIQNNKTEAAIFPRTMLLRLAVRLLNAGVNPEDYTDSLLGLYLQELTHWARLHQPFAIPIPGSCQVLGITDDYEILNPKEVYIRARRKTVSGDVAIYRDNIFHIADIQKATALSDAQVEERIRDWDQLRALKSMDNVIFFSQKDNPPLPNLLSGGDLDGDRFEVLSRINCPFWGDDFDTVPSDEYANEPHENPPRHVPQDGAFSTKSLARVVTEYIRNDCFDELETKQVCLTDERPTGMRHGDVKALARFLSDAVDFAKSGIKVDLGRQILNDRRFVTTRKPDFLLPLGRNDSTGEYVKSNGLLGKIYRMIKDREEDSQTEKLEEQQRKEGGQRITNLSLQRKILKVWGGEDGVNRVNFGIARIEPFLETFLVQQMAQYRAYLKGNNISEANEMDIFMQRRLDEFPHSHIEIIMEEIPLWLAQHSGINCSNPFTAGFRGLADVPPEGMQSIYRTILHNAWDISLRLSAHVDAGGEYAEGFGQSLAFVYLYAAHCELGNADDVADVEEVPSGFFEDDD